MAAKNAATTTARQSSVELDAARRDLAAAQAKIAEPFVRPDGKNSALNETSGKTDAQLRQLQEDLATANTDKKNLAPNWPRRGRKPINFHAELNNTAAQLGAARTQTAVRTDGEVGRRRPANHPAAVAVKGSPGRRRGCHRQKPTSSRIWPRNAARDATKMAADLAAGTSAKDSAAADAVAARLRSRRSTWPFWKRRPPSPRAQARTADLAAANTKLQAESAGQIVRIVARPTASSPPTSKPRTSRTRRRPGKNAELTAKVAANADLPAKLAALTDSSGGRRAPQRLGSRRSTRPPAGSPHRRPADSRGTRRRQYRCRRSPPANRPRARPTCKPSPISKARITNSPPPREKNAELTAQGRRQRDLPAKLTADGECGKTDHQIRQLQDDLAASNSARKKLSAELAASWKDAERRTPT